jgi:DNA invertase Pin-like site-specific DNA recombinase
MDKPLCVLYIRYSTLGQSEGTSAERQLEYAKKYADTHDLLLDDNSIYRDLGMSQPFQESMLTTVNLEYF